VLLGGLEQAMPVLLTLSNAVDVSVLEHSALVDIYNSLLATANSPKTNIKKTWTSLSYKRYCGWYIEGDGTCWYPHCSWRGVRCSGFLSRVVQLDLTNQGLSGKLPASIAKLAALEYLGMSSNHLTGELPKELSTMTNLV
jgi:hypothetical protein